MRTITYAIMKSVFSVMVSLFFIRYFNVFQGIDLIPDEYSFEIYLMIYLAIVEALLSKLENYVRERLLGEIYCVFYENKNNVSLKNNPSVSFLDDVCYIYCYISLKGPSWLYNENSLIISLPSWVAVQSATRSIAVVNGENEFVIRLDGLVPKSVKYLDNSSVDLKLGFIREELLDEYSYTIVPKLKKKKFVDYQFNKLNLCNTNRSSEDDNHKMAR